MKNLTHLIERCRGIQVQGKGQEEIVQFLRSQGCSKVESIVVLAKVLQIEMDKSKEIIHLSSTWADTRSRDESLHKSLEEKSSLLAPTIAPLTPKKN